MRKTIFTITRVCFLALCGFVVIGFDGTASAEINNKTLNRIITNKQLYDPDAVICGSGASANTGKTVVLDPGHSGTGGLGVTSQIDSATPSGSFSALNINGSGVKSFDNSGAPNERAAMWDVAQIIKSKLTAAGYNVVLTKNSVDENVGLLSRAKIANDANAAIAVSLHYDGNSTFGVPQAHFGVTPQEVGRYRANDDDGKKYTFTDAALAEKSKSYANIIKDERVKAGDNVNVAPLDLSFPRSRDLPSYGDISIVQLFSRVPWIYNEDGAKGFDKQKYATGIANGIMAAVPIAAASQAQATPPATAGSNVVGGIDVSAPNVQAAYQFLISSEGLPSLEPSAAPATIAAQAAGIVGNMMRESGPTISPSATNTQSGIHYGIVQWDQSRTARMRTWTASQGLDSKSLAGQERFVIYELKTTESKTLTALKTTSTPSDAAKVFFNKYERADDATVGDRQKNAVAVYNAFSGLPPDAGAAIGVSGTSCADTGAAFTGCENATGNAKILCEAKRYEGVYYQWGGGHQGYKAFVAGCPDPTNPPNNQPHGGSDAHNGNPSPCGLDCSGLVSIAVGWAFKDAFNGNYPSWNTTLIDRDNASWKSIPMTSVQAGDIVMNAGPSHVGIVQSYDASSGKITTFESHQTGETIRAITASLTRWRTAYRYQGPGSTVSL